MNKKIHINSAIKIITVLLMILIFACACPWILYICFAAKTKEINPITSMEEIKKFAVSNDSGEMMGFDEEGNFIMTTYDKIATSNIIYRTLGWTIKRYDAPIAGNESIRIKLTASGEPKVDPNNPQYEYNYFKCTKETIFNKVEQCSEEWLQELYSNGGFVYLDAIMTVYEYGQPCGSMNVNGETNGEVYFTFEGISGARGWADKEALRSHFNKVLQFPRNLEMLYGTYEIHYMELTDGDESHAVSLSYMDYDEEESKLRAIKKVLEAKDLSEENLIYVRTKIVYRRYGQEEKEFYTSGPYSLDNTKPSFRYVRVYYYYQREKEKTERGFIRYGDDLIETINKLKISAEIKENPKFDVEQGIPTSEQIRIDGTVQKYAMSLVYEHHYGTMLVPVTVHVSYTSRTVKEKEIIDTPVSYTQTCYVSRSYSYYTIYRLSLLLADEVIVKNYSFPEDNEEIIIDGFYSPLVVYETSKGEYTKLPTVSTSVNGGIIQGGSIDSGKIQQAAESACGEIEVINDTLIIDGEAIMKEGPFEAETEPPVQFYDEKKVTVEKGGIRIPNTKENGNWESEAHVSYRLYRSTQKSLYEIYGVNPVVIHTPVYCKGETSDEIAFNQQITPTTFHSLILGRDFRVSISTSGKHLDYPGYGTADYEKYTRYRQVRFPFTVYYQNQYIPENSWINLSGEEDEGTVAQTFYLPVGVEEGNYYIQFRTLALNYESITDGSMRTEPDANLSIENYAATNQIAVTVVGRLYGMEIAEVVDRPRWTNVFYQSDGVTKTGNTYRIGNKNCNGLPLNSVDERYIFPILYGSHPYNILAGPVRLGYRIKYRVKTVGNMRGSNDKVILQPTYYYVDENAKNRCQVDIYTKDHLQKVTQTIVLDASCRSYQTVSTRNVTSVERQNTSVQIWDGEYSLSPDVYFVPHGIDLKSYVQRKGGRIRQDDPLFLSGGYLIVQFRIYTISSGKVHLDYVNADNNQNGYCNMWKKEGFFYYRVDNRNVEWNFKDGDTFVFDRNKTIYDDYKSVGTH